MATDVHWIKHIIMTSNHLTELKENYHRQHCPWQKNEIEYQTEYIETLLRSLDLDDIDYYRYRNDSKLEGVLKKELDHLYEQKLREQLSYSFFGSSYAQVISEGKSAWEFVAKKNDMEKIVPFLKQYHYYLKSYYQCKYHLGTMKYVEVLEREYGHSIVDCFYQNLKEQSPLLIQSWHKLARRIGFNQNVVEELILTEQEVESFFRYFLSLIVLEDNEWTVSYEELEHCLEIPSYRSFCMALNDFLSLFGEIYAQAYIQQLMNQNVTYTHKEYTKYTIKEWIKLLPILTMDFAVLIREFFYEKLSHYSPKQIYKKLLAGYLRLHRNPLALGNINPIEKFMVEMLTFEQEERWFNGEVETEELLDSWKSLSQKIFHQEMFHTIETVLRLKYCTDGMIGRAFLSLSGMLSLFQSGMIQEQYHHPLEKLLKSFRQGHLDQWQPAFMAQSSFLKRGDHIKIFNYECCKLYRMLLESD